MTSASDANTAHSPLVTGRKLRDRTIAIAVFALVFLAFRGGGSQVYDARYSVLIAQRLATQGTFHLDDVPGATADPVDARGAPLLHKVNGRIHHYFPPGTPILTAPLMVVGRLFGATVFDAEGRYDLDRETRLQRRIAPLLMATLVAVIFLTSRVLLDQPTSLVVAAAAAFGSQIWSTASRGLWSHTWGILLVGLAIHGLLRSENGRGPARPARLATALCWAFFCRPTFAIPAVGIALFLAVRRRSELAVFVAVSALWLAGFAAFCLAQYGAVLPPYYDPTSRLESGHFAEALLGNLVSPSRGVLLYTPLVWVCGFLIVRYWRMLVHRDLVITALAITGAHWVAISMFPHWWGGWSYGSRLTTDLVPWFALLGILGLRALRDSGESRSRGLRATAWGILAASVLINANGGLWSEAVMWNRTPDVDLHPERLWDWRHPQFLHPFVESRGTDEPPDAS